MLWYRCHMADCDKRNNTAQLTKQCYKEDKTP